MWLERPENGPNVVVALVKGSHEAVHRSPADVSELGHGQDQGEGHGEGTVRIRGRVTGRVTGRVMSGMSVRDIG